jgi:hypothetical protein
MPSYCLSFSFLPELTMSWYPPNCSLPHSLRLQAWAPGTQLVFILVIIIVRQINKFESHKANFLIPSFTGWNMYQRKTFLNQISIHSKVEFI